LKPKGLSIETQRVESGGGPEEGAASPSHQLGVWVRVSAVNSPAGFGAQHQPKLKIWHGNYK